MNKFELQPDQSEREGQKPEETSLEPQEQEAPEGLHFLNEEELNTVLKEAKARGGEEKPVFENTEEEIVARASAVKLLRKAWPSLYEKEDKKSRMIETRPPDDRYWSEERKAKYEQARRERDEAREMRLKNERLSKEHLSQLYGFLADPKVPEQELNRAIDYLTKPEGGWGRQCEKLLGLTVINFIALERNLGARDKRDETGLFPKEGFSYPAKKVALEKLIGKIQGLEGKIEEKFGYNDRHRAADELTFSLSLFVERVGKNISEEQREELREKALSQLIYSAEGEDKYLRHAATGSLARLSIRGDEEVFSRMKELLARNAENEKIVEDFAWGIKYQVKPTPEVVSYIELLAPYVDKLSPYRIEEGGEELENRAADAFKAFIFTDTIGGENLFSYLKESLKSDAKDPDELWQELVQGETKREILEKEEERKRKLAEGEALAKKTEEEKKRLEERAREEAERKGLEDLNF